MVLAFEEPASFGRGVIKEIFVKYKPKDRNVLSCMIESVSAIDVQRREEGSL